ncbi:MAG: hypothetical protein KBD78_00580 [Oligoflexales bacterium]|nr:hypothetical protein [Oligoflexales bacterium]
MSIRFLHRLKIVCWVYAFIFDCVALAEQDNLTNDQTNQDIEQFYETSSSDLFIPRKPATSAENSASLRLNREGGLSAGYGMLLPNLFGLQIKGYHSVHHNFHVGLVYSSARQEKIRDIESSSMMEVKHAKQSYILLGLDARYFIFNSLYLSTSLAQREQIFEANAISIFYNYSINNKTTIKGQLLSLGFGNQWEWESGIFLDIEWYAFLLPINSNTNSNISNSGSDIRSINTQTQYDLDKVNSVILEESRTAKNPAYRALMFSLGYAY